MLTVNAVLNVISLKNCSKVIHSLHVVKIRHVDHIWLYVRFSFFCHKLKLVYLPFVCKELSKSWLFFNSLHVIFLDRKLSCMIKVNFDPIYRLRVEWRGTISHLLSTFPLGTFRWSFKYSMIAERPTNVISVIPMCPGGIPLICALCLKYGAEMSEQKWKLIKSTKAFQKSYTCTQIVYSWKEKQNNRKLIIVPQRLYFETMARLVFVLPLLLSRYWKFRTAYLTKRRNCNVRITLGSSSFSIQGRVTTRKAQKWMYNYLSKMKKIATPEIKTLSRCFYAVEHEQQFGLS